MSEPAAELRVASFNIRYDNPADGAHAWRHRRHAVRRCIVALDCDVTALQEVLPGQRRYLRAMQPSTRWYGVGREDGRRRGEQSPVLVRGSRLKVEGWQTLWLSSTPRVAGSVGIDARTPRVATVVHAQLQGRPIGVLSTHFDHRGTQARADAAEQLARLVGSEDRAWIVCGDLNAEITDRPLRTLADAGLRPAVSEEQGGSFHAFSGRGERRIDHILVGEAWEVLDGTVQRITPAGVLPSDHWPLVARLRLR